MHIDSLCCSCIASLSAPMFPGAAPPGVPSHRPVTQRPTASSMSSFLTILLSWLLSIPTHTFRLLCWAWSDTPQPSSAPSSLLSPLSIPQIPLAHYLRFFLSLLYHSSCKHLIIPYLLFLFSLPSLIAFPPLISLFTASLHLLLPFANLHLFFILLTSVKPRIVCLSGVLIPNVEKMWEMN